MEGHLSGLITLLFVYAIPTLLVSAFLLPRYAQSVRASRSSIGLGFMATAFAARSFAVVTKPPPNKLYL
jgi:hypothetical protein